MGGNVTERIGRLEDAVRNCQLRLLEHQKQYNIWSNTKADIVKEWDEAWEELYTLQGKDVRNIAGDIIEKLKELGITDGGIRNIYNVIPDKHKQQNAKQLFKQYGLQVFKEEDLNSIEEDVLSYYEDKVKVLPESRQKKLNEQLKDLMKKEPEEEPIKEEDFGIHQAEPPEGMQGPNEFSEAVRDTARWFALYAKHYNKIADEIETYKPQTPERIKQKANDWNTCINGTIIEKILNPIFITETRAEADRKYSTSIYHWIGIIKNRIEQSKHGAGKMAENTLTDPFGKPVYNKKGKLIKKSISRERVGDFEWPIVDTAADIITANAGMVQLHDWLENDQGGYRRYRKEVLHDYFAEASMGSIKSGNPEYEQFMREYKQKQLEKFSSNDKKDNS